MRSFTFLRKERKRILHSLKERKKTMCSERKRKLCPTLDPDPRNHILERPPRPLNQSEGDRMITNGPCQVHLNPFWVMKKKLSDI